MSFIAYDIILLVVFTLITTLFLYSRRKHLQRQGILYLYRTSIGVKIIDSTAKRYHKILNVLQYLVITCGYALMGIVIGFVAKGSYSYLKSPTLAKEIGAPLLLPLVPYVDKLVGNGLLPPFYFTYWIIIIAAIAIPHEFAHGIFARFHKIKVHSTGFGFLGPFLAAFVEPDEKQTNKSKKVSQLSILAAGTFANILMGILFTLVLWLFFALAFSPAGVYFTSYSTSLVNVSDIKTIEGLPFSNTLTLDSTNITLLKLISVNGEVFFIPPSSLEKNLNSNLTAIYAYDDSPALNAKLSGAITEIDGKKIISLKELRAEIQSHSPGDSINIKTISQSEEVKEFNINLGERDGKAFLGIGTASPAQGGLRGLISLIAWKIKNPLIYYQSVIGGFGIFIFDLLWWLILISLSVAFFNMIPMGLFDGGRFFYLTVLGLTGSKKIAETAFKISTWAILSIVFLLMFKWLLIFF